ncbi:hypothetical protein H0H92_010193 [Tricholoma furcatifolium]|nr:hypothetical protein H0H92_010193 [Tricholoma furcatifolium]
MPIGPKGHERIVAVRQLISRGIPCILWGEDGMKLGHGVRLGLNEQQIIVPNDLIETASNILQEHRYTPVPHAQRYLEPEGFPHAGTTPFPLAVHLWHRDIPNNDPYRLEPIPDFILLLPQSYFGLDVDSTERFQLLPAPIVELDPLNKKILIPKYHTFLEVLVHFLMDPPLGLEVPHMQGTVENGLFILRLLDSRLKWDIYDPDDAYANEVRRTVLDELQTEEARRYIDHRFRNQLLKIEDLRDFKKKHVLPRDSLDLIELMALMIGSMNARQPTNYEYRHLHPLML